MVAQVNSALPAGFRLENYIIEKQLSLGGFSIVYLARDVKTKETVAIKEFLPNHLALRMAGEVRPQVDEEHKTLFRYGVKCFFEEGKALAKMNHPNVIRVLNFFRANGTVYIVMAYEKGFSLHYYIKKNTVDEQFLRDVFINLLDGLYEVHVNHLLHLDIKPANVYLREDQSPVLLDFGAARQMLEKSPLILKPMYTPGFASPEHYGDRSQLGTWSDIYSIGASIYNCLSKAIPPAADERQKNDTLMPAMRRWEGQYTDRFLEIVDWCLNLNYLYRPQTVPVLQNALLDLPPLPQKGQIQWDTLWHNIRKTLNTEL